MIASFCLRHFGKWGSLGGFSADILFWWSRVSKIDTVLRYKKKKTKNKDGFVSKQTLSKPWSTILTKSVRGFPMSLLKIHCGQWEVSPLLTDALGIDISR